MFAILTWTPNTEKMIDGDMQKRPNYARSDIFFTKLNWLPNTEKMIDGDTQKRLNL